MTTGRAGQRHDFSDVADVRTAVDFAARLTELRQASGRSLRNLADAINAPDPAGKGNGDFVHASYSTLGEWCRGDRLPQLTHRAAFERLLAELGVDDTAPWMDALTRVRERSARGGGEESPYRGLDSFRTDDSDWFFGREELTDQLVTAVNAAATGDGPRIVWVVGASGSGKSSLLHAGLVPRLGDQGWGFASMTPGESPVERLDALEVEGDGHQMVLIDAFEELFFTVYDSDDRAAFAHRLLEISRERVVVCGVRIDFFADVVELPGLGRTVTGSQVLVRPMRADELSEAIVEPATRAGGSVEDDLVEVLVRELIPDGADHAQAGALPLLSFALSKTWALRRRGRMTLTDHFAIGGLGGAIEATAEAAYAQLNSDQRLLAEQVFLRLVHIDHSSVTRRRATRTELAGIDDTAPGSDDVVRVMDPFIAARMITVDANSLQLTHEAVLSAWPRLGRWVDTHRAALAQHRILAVATDLWLDHDRDPSALATGNRLTALNDAWQPKARSVRLSRDEQAFLKASQAKADDEAAARRRRTGLMRTITSIAVCLAMVTGILAIIANASRADAESAREDALSRQIAVTAEGLAGRHLSLAQQLAVVAYDVAPTAEARAALLDLGALPHPSRYLGGAGSTAVTISTSGAWFALTNNLDATVQIFSRSDDGYQRAGVIAVGEPGVEVYALAATPSGDILAVGDTTPAVTLWDVADPEEPLELASLDGPAGPVQKIAISPDGTEMVAVGATELWQTEYSVDPDPVDAVIRWDISDPADPERLDALPIATEVTWSAAYSPDGSLLAVGDEEGRMSVWTTGNEPEMLSHTQVGTRSTVTVAMSDGAVAAGTRTAELTVWDIADPVAPTEIEITPPDFSTWVNSASFSPDGTRFVAGGSDTVLQVWDASTWRHVTALPHPDPITQTAFSDDGTLITGAVDGTARLWNVAVDLPERLIGIVGDSSFSADGTRAAGVSGWDAAIWDTDPGRLERSIHIPGDDLSIGSGSISPDGTMLAYGTVDGLVRIHDLTDPTPADGVDLPNGTGTGTVQSAYFSADNKLLAAGGDDTNVRIWDLSGRDGPELSATIEVPTQIVLQTTWSPTDRTLAISSGEGNVYLYDATDPADPQPLSTIDVFDSEAYTAAFTPDGATLAIGGTESDVWIFDITDSADPQPIGDPLTAPSSRIYDLTFDGDGDRLAAASTDGTVWIWDTAELSSPEHVATLGPRDDSMFTVAFHPTENRLLGSGIDPTVWYWDLDVDRVIDEICTSAGDIITEDEWMTHLPSEPYNPPCADR